MKRLILQLTAVTLCLTGCAATHYHERKSERVTFYLMAPGAEKVEFVSSLDAYNPHRASRLSGSRWAVTVVPNSEFRYFYIVDGAVFLPECELYEKDDFGSRNCVYVPGK
ncbi:MAG: hypothetical protein HKO68_12765 [Desulfobacterales bacterium]|nr:hypothetical protein [Deltaproteobacteria bacterium]NNL77200.1 hypothetical protein [Desulfobacterales bacterium]